MFDRNMSVQCGTMRAIASRLDVSSWEQVLVETRGATEKAWIRMPGGSSSEPSSDWLFKPAFVQGNGVRQVGDWTEAVSSRIAGALDLPAAESTTAVRHGVEGVIVRNVRPRGYDMVTGRMAMIDAIAVETRDSHRVRTASVGHSLANVMRSLEGYGPPPGWASWAGCTAIDVMASYLVLDALIGNGDRHEQNWSVLRAQSSLSALDDTVSATYDLEASLGFQLSDEQRAARLRDPRGMESFASKGLARRFDGDQATPLLEVAVRAARSCTIQGLRRIALLVDEVSRADFGAIVMSVGGVSEVTRNFAINVLNINGRRITDAKWNS